MTNKIMVEKRNGDKELLNLEKLHKMTEEACEGLSGVSSSEIEMNSGIQFFDGVSTKDIQNILIRSASDLISLDAMNYQYAAARLQLFALRKEVFGQFEYLPLEQVIDINIKNKVYDKEILNWYTKKEIQKIGGFIKHQRDFDFTYAGLRQVMDKYLIQDRSTGQLFETPQYMYIMIAATLFAQYPKDIRLKYVKKYYDAISSFKINIPTPVMSGVRTPIRQFASCVLVDSDDTLASIFTSDMSIGYYTAQRAGIGINAGRIRGINSKIRDGEIQHTGVIPFLKKFEATVRCCTQNGVRGGSATVHFPIWHKEIEDILVLKNNKGSEDNRVRKLDYSIQFSKLFYERFIQNKQISLFSPHDVPGLYEAFGTDKFDDLYCKYERAYSIPKKKVSAQQLFLSFLRERAETGRMYLMNIDHCNTHSSFKDRIYMSNLCQEITLPTKPLDHIDDEKGEIALCILSAINMGKIKKITELEELCDLAVRSLDEIIDFQNYPIRAAELSTKARRSLGIGYIGLAHYLAKNKVKYNEPKAWQLVHDTTEALQYYLIKASVQLAKEKGACSAFSRTKYSDGILPIDTYKQEVDSLLIDSSLKYDWESLRKEVVSHGMRHSTLTAQMPSESSSVVCNEPNGIEQPRGYLSIKKSKKGPLKQIVPSYYHYRNYYSLLWDEEDNTGYINIVAIMQKFFDQSISGNWSYNPENYENNEVPLSVIMKDMLQCYKLGWKTVYYHNTYDSKKDDDEDKIELVVTPKNIIIDEDEEDCDSCVI